jgi:hypothetical protein
MKWGQSSSVGIVTGYVLDKRGVRVRVPVKNFLFSMTSRAATGALNFLYNVNCELFPRGLSKQGVKLTVTSN